MQTRVKEERRFPGYQTPNKLLSWESLQSPGCQKKSIPCPTAMVQNGSVARNTSTALTAGAWSSVLDTVAASNEPSSRTAASPAQLSGEQDRGQRLALVPVKHSGSPHHAAGTLDPGLQPRSPARGLLSPVWSQHTAHPCPPALFCTAHQAGLLPKFSPAVH